MIGWCYANNGDLAMALRSDSTLSRLVLEQEMRDIGILNPQISDQQKEVLEEAYKKKGVFLYGNTGAGKTVIGAEVVKIKMAQWIRNNVSGTVLILTYSREEEALSNLNKYFKNTLFKNMLRCKGIKIEFKNFADAFQISSDDLYSTKVIKAKIHDYCKNVTGKQIILVDEFETNHLTEDDEFIYNIDDVNDLEFSDFSEHDNVDFIICVSPIGRRTGSQGRSRPINYNLDHHKSQYIKWLEGRYRNTKKILEFTKMLQSYIYSNHKASTLSMTNDKDVSNLPSPFPSHDPPVIWIDFDASKPKSLQTVLKKVQNLISSSEPGSQVPVLSFDGYVRDFPSWYGYTPKPGQVTEFEKSLMTMINSDNKRIIQPYMNQEFIGMEADIVIVPLLQGIS